MIGFKGAPWITKPHSVSIVARMRCILKLRINEGETWGSRTIEIQERDAKPEGRSPLDWSRSIPPREKVEFSESSMNKLYGGRTGVAGPPAGSHEKKKRAKSADQTAAVERKRESGWCPSREQQPGDLNEKSLVSATQSKRTAGRSPLSQGNNQYDRT